MRTTRFVSWAVLVVLLGSIAHAQSRDGGRRPPPGPDHPGPHPLLRTFDSDRDGALSGEELDQASTVLRGMDANGDGSVSEEELIQARPGPGHPPKGDPFIQKFMEKDADKDGSVDKKEFTAWADGLFVFTDTNKDGKIDREEAEKLGAILRPDRRRP